MRQRPSRKLTKVRRIRNALATEPLGDSEKTLRRFYDSASVLMGTVEITEDDIIHISDNQAAATFFSTTPGALQGRSARAMGVSEPYIRLWLDAYQASVTSPEAIHFDYHHEGKGWLNVTVNYVGLSEAGKQRFLYVVIDISDRKQAEQELLWANERLELGVKERTAELAAANSRLQQEAHYDALTGLPNRLLFGDRLRYALERYKREPDLGFAVLFMDLDHFKVINDSLGHSAGDALLVALAGRLTTCVRDGDTVARFGGDEFTVLLEHCDAARAAEVVWRIRRALEQPFTVWGRSFTLSSSVGVVLSETGHSHPQELLRDADLAMYRAKVQRSGQHEVFEPSMREKAVTRLELEAELRDALASQALEVYYQPIVRLADRRLVGFEALARWRHPARGLLAPGAFIPLAEETGLVTELDRFVLRSACRQLAAWQDTFPYLNDLSVNVNFSSRNFLQRTLPHDIERTLLQHDLNPLQLNVEVTESLLMHPAAAVDEVVAQLIELGVGLCLDDFGTGYASLSYLKRFPATGLKIDRSFIRDMGENDRSSVLAKGVTDMAQGLGMRVVAEGIETQEQLTRLLELGCEHGQGYLFSKPLSSEATTAFMAGMSKPQDS